MRICYILCYLTFTFTSAQHMRRRAILTSMHDRGYRWDNRLCAQGRARRQINVTMYNARLYVEIHILHRGLKYLERTLNYSHKTSEYSERELKYLNQRVTGINISVRKGFFYMNYFVLILQFKLKRKYNSI